MFLFLVRLYITSKCTCPIMQMRAYTCLPRLLRTVHLLSLPSLGFAWLVFRTYLMYFPMAIDNVSYAYLLLSLLCLTIAMYIGKYTK